MGNPTYPTTLKVDQVDYYHGIGVPDPYRWLEDGTSPDRAAWIAAQNAATDQYLAKLSLRDSLRARLEQLVAYPRYYPLFRRQSYFFVKKNAGLQNQLVLDVQRGLRGSPRTLIDPHDISPDGSSRLTSVMLSKDAKYLAYGVAHGGGEWEEYYVLDMRTRLRLADRIRWVKSSTIAWHGSGFYYSSYTAPCNDGTALTARNEHHQVWYHRVGTLPAADTLVHEDRAHPLYQHLVTTTEDERFAVLSVLDYGGGWSGNALFAADLCAEKLAFAPLVTSFEDECGVVDTYRGKLLVLTNCKAQNRRLVLIDPANSQEAAWKTIIPETDQVLESVRPVGRRLFATYARGGVNQLRVFTRTGKHEHDISLPEDGSVTVIGGGRHDAEVLWGFHSFTMPMTVYRYNIARRTSSTFRKWELPWDTGRYETTRVMYPARDGVGIPLFIVHRRGIRLDGRNPLLLHGYGGFGISLGSSFDPLLIALLERGVIYAIACVRGGGEYGDAWHRAGQRDKKQVVFDDFIAAAEWLQAEGYTSPDTCAVHGVSNGGLLVGAVMTQRPDLFRVALPVGGVMDMLRFHKFTMGWAWTAEYGSSEESEMLPILLAYSPLHNIKEGVSYPATLVITSEHDDSVVPAHSFKLVATLQERGAEPGPYLIRIGTKTGHAPVSLPKALDERADLYAFVLAHLSTTPG